ELVDRLLRDEPDDPLLAAARVEEPHVASVVGLHQQVADRQLAADRERVLDDHATLGPLGRSGAPFLRRLPVRLGHSSAASLATRRRGTSRFLRLVGLPRGGTMARPDHDDARSAEPATRAREHLALPARPAAAPRPAL